MPASPGSAHAVQAQDLKAELDDTSATETEMKEKKARVEDALQATRVAVEEGIVPGGGVTVLRTLPALATLELDGNQEFGVSIVRRAPPRASSPTTSPAARDCAATSCAHASLLANHRLHILPDGAVRLDFKKPWSDGTASCDLEPLALLARLAALVPHPRRHLTLY